MKRSRRSATLFVWLSVFALLTVSFPVLAAVPVAADPPDVSVYVYDEIFLPDIDNPCTDTLDLIRFEGTTTLREIRFGFDPELGTYGRRITPSSTEITGPPPWSGRVTGMGVEFANDREGVLILTLIMVTNSDTGQKFRFVIRAHNDPNTGEPINGAFGATCVRP